MSRLADQLASTDQAIGALTLRIDLYRKRVAKKSKNPALANRASQLLPAMCSKLDELVRFRKRLIHGLEVEAFLSPQDRAADRPPVVPRYMR
jgi:hypothetical protein